MYTKCIKLCGSGFYHKKKKGKKKNMKKCAFLCVYIWNKEKQGSYEKRLRYYLDNPQMYIIDDTFFSEQELFNCDSGASGRNGEKHK